MTATLTDAGIGPSRYSPAVWARFLAPRHAGRPEKGLSGCARSPAHHLEVCFHARRGDDGRFAEVGFSAVGCPTTIAVADYCAEQLLAGSVVAVGGIMEALEIPDARRHCVLLCEDALTELRKALEIE